MSLLRKLPKLLWTPRRNSGHTTHSPGAGWFGSNVPFPVDSPPKLLAIFAFGCFTGFGLPFFTLRYRLLKNRPE